MNIFTSQNMHSIDDFFSESLSKDLHKVQRLLYVKITLNAVY